MWAGKEEQEIKEEGTFHAHTSLLNQMEIIVVGIGMDRAGRQDEVPHCVLCAVHCPHQTLDD